MNIPPPVHPPKLNFGIIADLPLPTEVEACTAQTLVKDVIKKMQVKKIGSLVMTNDLMKPIGIFTERDYLMKIAGNESIHLNNSIMNYVTRNPQTIQIDDQITKALHILKMGRFRHLVIVDREGKISGLLSVKDILNYLVIKMGEM